MSLTTFCTDTVGSVFQQCLSCIAPISLTSQSYAQETIDEWNMACNGTLSVGTPAPFFRFMTLIIKRVHDLSRNADSSVLPTGLSVTEVTAPVYLAAERQLCPAAPAPFGRPPLAAATNPIRPALMQESPSVLKLVA